MRVSMPWMMAIVLMLSAGCSSMKGAGRTDAALRESESATRACVMCHPDECATWTKSPHADSGRMSTVKDTALKGCGACHEQSAAHAEDPAKVTPGSIGKMGKKDQNEVCGKCHYNKDVTDGNTVNPRNRHGLFMSVGLEGFSRQMSCLDCHRGHGKKADMLKSVRAHTCFGCHKEAVVTMGVFQPVNYLTAGKTCVGCHPAHGGSRPRQVARMTAGMVVTCIVCHPTGDLHSTW